MRKIAFKPQNPSALPIPKFKILIIGFHGVDTVFGSQPDGILFAFDKNDHAVHFFAPVLRHKIE